MKVNTNMKSILHKYLTEAIEVIPQNNAYPIWTKTDVTGRVYWGVSSFCGLDDQPILSSEALSQLEWAGNEVYLDTQTDDDIPHILRQAIGILAFWKHELETKYPDMPFYLFASYDDGNAQVLSGNESPVRSFCLRFWAHRDGSAVIDLSDFDYWAQPAIIEFCNF